MPNRKKITFTSLLIALFLSWNNDALSATATVDFAKTNQTIDGFGGSSAWCGALNDAKMDALFGNGPDQIGLTILRLRIDPHGSWADEKSNATKAKARGATVFATPWSPPESLKTNNNVNKGYIDSTKFASFTAWMKSFWTYCGSANVDIMSIENEPDYAQQINYEGCGWSATNFEKYCKTYAPQIGKPIMMPESMNYNTTLSDATLKDSAAAANVTYIGGHFYGGTPKNPYTLAIDLKKHIWETEHYLTGDDGNTCMKVAQEIMDCLHNLNFNAYVWWWMTYNSSDGIYSNNALMHRGWVLGQFSKWVRPGYIRVDATPYNVQSGVYVVAFKGDSNVVVVMNSSTSSQSVTFNYTNSTVSTVHKYTSSQSKSGKDDGAVTATNNSFTTTLDAQSVTTFVSANPTTVIRMSKSEGEKYSNENFSVTSGHPVNSFIYLINGKRECLQKTNDQRNISQGIYIMNDKIYMNAITKKTLSNTK